MSLKIKDPNLLTKPYLSRCSLIFQVVSQHHNRVQQLGAILLRTFVCVLPAVEKVLSGSIEDGLTVLMAASTKSNDSIFPLTPVWAKQLISIFQQSLRRLKIRFSLACNYVGQYIIQYQISSDLQLFFFPKIGN